MNQTDEFILDALKEQGLVTDELIAEINASVEALQEEPVGGKELAFMDGLLAKIGLAQEEIVNFLAGELSMEAIDLSEANPTEEVLGLLTPELARKYEAYPVGTTGAEVEIVFGNPLDENVQAD